MAIDNCVELSPYGGEWIAGIGGQAWIQSCQAGPKDTCVRFAEEQRDSSAGEAKGFLLCTV